MSGAPHDQFCLRPSYRYNGAGGYLHVATPNEQYSINLQNQLTLDGTFDQVFTSCTFCSVPKPVDGLKALRRVLRPGGELHMFEHTGSRYFPFNTMLNQMTWLSSRMGPDMNRDTVTNVKIAGFTVREVNHVFMDVVKTISATA